MKKIVMWPDAVLRQKSVEVTALDEPTKKEIDDLKKILLKSENGAGLASNQIGVTKRFFGLKDQKGEVAVFVNPKITKTKGKKDYSSLVDDEGESQPFLEGCLSFPDLFGTVKRWLEIEVEWREVKDDNLIRRTASLVGFAAIVWQHELDHLDGVVFLDHIKEEGGKLYLFKDKSKKEVDVSQILSK